MDPYIYIYSFAYVNTVEQTVVVGGKYVDRLRRCVQVPFMSSVVIQLETGNKIHTAACL